MSTHSFGVSGKGIRVYFGDFIILLADFKAHLDDECLTCMGMIRRKCLPQPVNQVRIQTLSQSVVCSGEEKAELEHKALEIV